MSKRVVGSDEPVEADRPEMVERVEEAPEPVRYQALMTLWLSVEARHVNPGETVDLSHFDTATLADFVERGFVQRVV